MLGGAEGLGKVNPLFVHPGEDVVGGAVYYGVDAPYLVGHQVVLEGGNQGDTAANAAFIEQADIMLLGQG